MKNESQENDYESIKSLLMSLSQEVAIDDKKGDEYNIKRPHRFTREYLSKLDFFSDQAAKMFTAELVISLGRAFRVELAGFVQDFAELRKETPNSYRVPISLEGKVIGYLLMPPDTGVTWVTSFMGGGISEDLDVNRALSELEKCLLHDITLKVISAFSKTFEEFGGAHLKVNGDLTDEDIETVSDEAVAEFCVIGFKMPKMAVGGNFELVILSNVIETILGIPTTQKRTVAENRDIMLRKVKSATMPLRVVLDQVEVPFRTLATMESGDVLVLSKKVNELIVGQIAGMDMLTGFPVNGDGGYGFQVNSLKGVF